MPRRLLPRPAIALFFGAFLVSTAAQAQPQPPPPAAPTPATGPAPAQPVPPPPVADPPAPLPWPAQPFPAQPLPPPAVLDTPAPPPVEPAPARPEGVSATGLPFSQRGGIVADLAAIRFSAGNTGQQAGQPPTTIDLAAHVPVRAQTFVDANLPIGFGAVGNPMVGVHHVFHVADAWWINLGGAFGFPLVNNSQFVDFAQAKAFWDTQSFLVETVPFAVRFGFEGHAGLLEVRVELDPVAGISIASAPPAGSFQRAGSDFVALQHSIELQLGHAIGGGIRYQGVVSNLDFILANQNLGNQVTTSPDHYQGAIEPFVRFYHDPIFVRFGLLLPVDSPLGTPFATSWGVRAMTGFNLD